MPVYYRLLKYVLIVLIIAVTGLKAYNLQYTYTTPVQALGTPLTGVKAMLPPGAQPGFYTDVQPADSALKLYYCAQFWLQPHILAATPRDTLVLINTRPPGKNDFKEYNTRYSRRQGQYWYILLTKK